MKTGGTLPRLALYSTLLRFVPPGRDWRSVLLLRTVICQVLHLVDGMQQGVQYCSLRSCILSNMTIILQR